MWHSGNLNEVKVTIFAEVNKQFQAQVLGCEEAAQLLGVSVSTFFRMRKRCDAEGPPGLADKRVGKLSHRRAPVDEMMEVINLFETRYFDFTVKHFHEKLPGHGIHRSYTWTKNVLQNAGKVAKAPKRGAHRRKRPRRPMAGMLLHQDGSTHQWVPGKMWDLIVTMDDATSETYSMFFVEQEGTMSTFRALLDVISSRGLFCSLYVDRGSHYWKTPEAGGKVDRENLTQVGRALAQLNIEMIPAYSPEARGRSERMFGTLQSRLPQELRLQGITSMTEANRFLSDTYQREHNKRFMCQAEQSESAFIPWAGPNLQDILCAQEGRTVGNDNTVRYKGLTLQIPADKHRCHYVKVKVRVHEYTDGKLAIFHGPRKLATYDSRGREITAKAEGAA